MKKILAGLLALVLTLGMAGCGSETADTASEAETTAPVETATEEAPTTWFDENRITFTEGGFSLPAYICAINSDGSVDEATNETVEFTQNEAYYSDPWIEASAPDSDGNVTYTVTYEVKYPVDYTCPKGQGSFTYRVGYKGYDFVDAYTGTVLPGGSGDYTADCVIEAGGKSYAITVSRKKASGFSEPTREWFENDTKCRVTKDGTFSYTLTAVVPEDYDGLILAIDGKGTTEYKKLSGEIKEAHPFDDDIATTIFKDVSHSAVTECPAWSYSADAGSGDVELMYVFNDQVYVQFNGGIEESKTKADGFITVNCKDGTSVQVSSERIDYFLCPPDEYSDHDTGVINAVLDAAVDVTQIESVVVDGRVYADGELTTIELGW